MFLCKCGKEYKNKRSLRKHELQSESCFSNREITCKEKYLINPKRCVQCSNIIPYEKRTNNFCNSSCSATYNNKRKPPKEKHKCINCGNETNNPKFCSGRCSVDFTKLKRYENVLDGTASHVVCKKYLIEKHGNICLNKDCAWDFSKQKVNVELEHIDGDSTNNKLTNLTLLCPNCHSLTPTYKAKNRGNGRYTRRQRYVSGKSY